MNYICFKCGKNIELSDNRIRCPYCGGKILYKKKPETTINVDVK